MNTTTIPPKFGWSFWIKLIMTILSAFGASLGASACGLTDVAAASAGFVTGAVTAIN